MRYSGIQQIQLDIARYARIQLDTEGYSKIQWTVDIAENRLDTGIQQDTKYLQGYGEIQAGYR